MVVTYEPRAVKIKSRGRDVYIGYPDGEAIYWNKLSPAKSLKIVNHSPDGFAWGYGGSGPSQLALAILLEIYGEEKAKADYQDFKFQFIASLPQDQDWEMDVEDIDNWMETQ